ncbi:hypothetical protein RI367_006072 [Sorochytrium milnesiophthora]
MTHASASSKATTLCGLLPLRSAVLIWQWLTLAKILAIIVTSVLFTPRLDQERPPEDASAIALAALGFVYCFGILLHPVGIHAVRKGHQHLYKAYVVVYSIYAALSWGHSLYAGYLQYTQPYVEVQGVQYGANTTEPSVNGTILDMNGTMLDMNDTMLGVNDTMSGSITVPGHVFKFVCAAYVLYEVVWAVYILRLLWRYVRVQRIEIARAKIDPPPPPSKGSKPISDVVDEMALLLSPDM